MNNNVYQVVKNTNNNNQLKMPRFNINDSSFIINTDWYEKQRICLYGNRPTDVNTCWYHIVHSSNGEILEGELNY